MNRAPRTEVGLSDLSKLHLHLHSKLQDAVRSDAEEIGRPLRFGCQASGRRCRSAVWYWEAWFLFGAFSPVTQKRDLPRMPVPHFHLLTRARFA